MVVTSWMQTQRVGKIENYVMGAFWGYNPLFLIVSLKKCKRIKNYDWNLFWGCKHLYSIISLVKCKRIESNNSTFLRLWSFVFCKSFRGYDLSSTFHCKNFNFFCSKVASFSDAPETKVKQSWNWKQQNFSVPIKTRDITKGSMKVKVASRSFFRSRNEFFADSWRRKKRFYKVARLFLSSLRCLLRSLSWSDGAAWREAEKWKIMKFFIFTQLDTILWMHNITYSIVSAFCSLYYIILG